MNYWLVIVAAVLCVFVLGLVFYLVTIYQSEEDRNQAWLPKSIVILGFSLACFNVLLLPYDVANRENHSVATSVGGGINTVLVWQIVMYAIAGLTFVIVPFAMSYYEAHDPDDPNMCQQVKPAICYTSASVLVFGILLVVLWLTVGKADIPYILYVGNPQACEIDGPCITWDTNATDQQLSIQVSLFVYLVGLMSAVGWLLFFLFGGVGLAALPYDSILAFRDRPQPMTLEEYTRNKTEIGKEAARLIPVGKKIDEEGRRGGGRKHKKKTILFKRQVAELETAYEKLEISYSQGGGSILKAILGLVVGIVGFALSVAWFLHVILWNAFHITPFLNSLFITLDGAFSLMGVLAYGVFAFYLLWCVIKGCTKFGLNFVIFTVHPMKLGATLMNSFLFNTLLILIASVSTVQFCAMSFDEYAANTAVSTVFTTYVERLKGINYIVMYLQYPLLAMTLLTLAYLLICPKRQPKVDSDDDD